MSSFLFFDLDGTLTEPKPGIVGSIRYALSKLGVEDQPDDLDWCIGPPLKDSFEILVGSEKADEGVAAYRERYGREGIFENAVYDGLVPMLEVLKGAGHSLFVATSKPHVYASQILEHFDLDGYFSYCFGSELDGTRSKKGDLLAYALTQSGAEPSKSIMIGDREHDIIGAKANHIRSVGVLWGYGPRAELETAGADMIAPTIQDLQTLLLNA